MYWKNPGDYEGIILAVLIGLGVSVLLAVIVWLK